MIPIWLRRADSRPLGVGEARRPRLLLFSRKSKISSLWRRGQSSTRAASRRCNQPFVAEFYCARFTSLSKAPDWICHRTHAMPVAQNCIGVCFYTAFPAEFLKRKARIECSLAPGFALFSPRQFIKISTIYTVVYSSKDFLHFRISMLAIYELASLVLITLLIPVY